MKIMEKNLIGISKVLRKDDDWLHINDGLEGSGKSTLGLHMCKIIDPDFTIDNIAMDRTEVNKILYSVKKGEKKYSAIMIDEGGSILFSREAMSAKNKEMVKSFMANVRALNVFVVVNTPNIFFMDNYIKTHRLKSWTRVYRKGLFGFFSRRQAIEIVKNYNKKDKKIFLEPAFYDTFDKMQDKLWLEYYMKKQKYVEKQLKQNYENSIDEEEKMYTVMEVANLIGTDSIKIRELIINGKINAIQNDDGNYVINYNEKKRINRMKLLIDDKEEKMKFDERIKEFA